MGGMLLKAAHFASNNGGKRQLNSQPDGTFTVTDVTKSAWKHVMNISLDYHTLYMALSCP